MNLEQYVKSKKIEERATAAAKRAVDEVMRSENQLYEFGIADQMRSDFDQWAYDNGLSRTSDEDGYFSKATQAASGAWNYRQTEVGELKKKLQLSQTEIKSLLSRVGIYHKKIESLRNSNNALKKRVNSYSRIGLSLVQELREARKNPQSIKDASEQQFFGSLERLEQALKGCSDASN